MKQEGQPGSKTITTPITVNPLTGEKVGEGQPTEEITVNSVDKIVEFGGEKPKIERDLKTQRSRADQLIQVAQ